MANIAPEDVELVQKAVATCAAEHRDQLAGRKFTKTILDHIKRANNEGLPMYTVLVSLWVVIHTLAEEWRDAQ